jgi:hypothetical protein
MTHLSAINDRLSLIAITGPLALFRSRIVSVRLIFALFLFLFVLLVRLVGLFFHRFSPFCEVSEHLINRRSGPLVPKIKKNFFMPWNQ